MCKSYVNTYYNDTLKVFYYSAIPDLRSLPIFFFAKTQVIVSKILNLSYLRQLIWNFIHKQFLLAIHKRTLAKKPLPKRCHKEVGTLFG